MMNLKFYSDFPNSQRRLFCLCTIGVVVGLWCLILPPMQIEELSLPKLVEEPEINKTTKLNSLPLQFIDFKVWDLPLTEQKEIKPVIVPVKKEQIVKEIPVTKMKVLPPFQLMPVVPVIPVVTQSSLPIIKYLGQVKDISGVQVFLSIDTSNVVMRPGLIYEQQWKVIQVDDREVKLEFIPTKLIINIPKTI